MAQLIYTFKALALITGCIFLLSLACTIIMNTINTIKKNNFERRMVEKIIEKNGDDIAFYNDVYEETKDENEEN